jgi:hypothetical protein
MKPAKRSLKNDFRELRIWQHLTYVPWRRILVLCTAIGIGWLAYLLWSPGKYVRNGKHDLRNNGIWIQHGWLGDDLWFRRYDKDMMQFRNDQKIKDLADLLVNHGIKYVFPHVCPCDPTGTISPIDHAQTERFLNHFQSFHVIPWIGGVLGRHCSPELPQWRINFISSIIELLQAHPRLAGVQLNIEPMPTGNTDFLTLLEELRQAMPAGKIISVAAYPPPTYLHPFPEIHWDEQYYRQVAHRVDQLVPMMYDTAISLQKLYRHLMAQWTNKVLMWSENAHILLGVPVYDDAGVGYHIPEVENLKNALLGIHAGLSKYKTLPNKYAGIAIYCGWEMDQTEWDYFNKEFERIP